MKAIWEGTTIAQDDSTVVVEGNHYFSPDGIKDELLVDSATTSHCPWKGDASYKSIKVGDKVNEDAAWFYPAPQDAAAEIKDRFAFWKGVEIQE